MGKIHILDDHLANQIAAGEVVERPASVVKELLENSIDAGSTKIEIVIKEGGLSYIGIKDNGEGLDDDDVDKAFLRHATSKIKLGKDLFRISTLGFRGEALPSIAAVSRLILRTSANDSGRGIEVKLAGGKIIEKKETAFVKGTEIIVEDIFYNTPARLKYLKSLQTELGHIIDYVNRLSLAYPTVSFTLIHNDRLILRTNGDGQLLHVVAAIYGTTLAKNLIEFKNENLDFQLTGFTTKPEITRANKNHISIFINGRFIKNFMLAQALIRGFKTLLMVNRYPIAALHLNMDPAIVDVNVHPAKLEARFSKEKELSKFVEETINESLNRQSFIREPIKIKESKNNYKSDQAFFDLNINYQNDIADKKEIDNENSNSFLIKRTSGTIKNLQDFNENYQLEGANEQKSELNNQKLPFLDPIAQFQGTYIIAQSEEGLYLIDQHAAHERINFEKNLVLMNEEQGTSQELLVPLTLDFPESEINQIFNKIQMLPPLGIDIELFGKQTFIVRAIPGWIPKGQEAYYIEKMLQMLMLRDELNMEEIRKDLAASSSCKASIKANQHLSKKEMETLVAGLRETNNPYFCPHGRPVIVHFSLYEIEKMFKRVV